MNNFFASLLLFFALFSSTLHGQCPNSNEFLRQLVVPTWGQNSMLLYQGSYVTVEVIQGNYYRFSTCGSSNFNSRLTLYPNAGSVLADEHSGCSNSGNGALIVWRATFTGTLRVLLNHRSCSSHSKDHDKGEDYSGVNYSNTATVLVEHLPPPPNDLCENATPLAATSLCAPTMGTLFASNVERALCVNYAYNDVWYSFTATHPNTEIVVDANGDFDPVIELYAGSDCSGLQLLRCVNNFSSSDENLPIGGLTVGRTYYVRVYHRATTTNPNSSSNNNDAFPTDPNFTICVENIPAPPNDDCANAIVIPHHWRTECGATLGSTRGATASSTPASSLPACTGDADDDVWYVFDARHTEAVIIVESLRDFAFQVFADDCATSFVCQNSTSALGGSERLHITGLEVGTRYRVRVYTVGTLPPSGEIFNICVTVPPPSNDACADAIELTQQADCNYHEGTVFGATASNPTIAAVHCTGDDDDDVWFRFRPTSANARLRLESFDDFDGVAQVMFDCRQYSRDCINDIDGSGIEERLLTNLTVGREYYIRVYSYGSTRPQSSGFNLCIMNETPTNVSELMAQEGDQWRLFPNPASDVLRLTSLETDLEGTALWAIRDMTGRSLKTGVLPTHSGINEWTFDVQDLPAGVYWLQWQQTQTGEWHAWKWVKQ